MNSYRHLVVIDLSSYGSALAIINQFCDDEDVKVFEISPLGSAALLILLTKESTAATILQKQIVSHWGAAVINTALILDSHNDLLPTYLSQKSSAVAKNILVLESASVSTALATANNLLNKEIQLLDLRVVRTFPSNTILTVTGENPEALLAIATKQADLKTTFVANVQKTLQEYFQISK